MVTTLDSTKADAPLIGAGAAELAAKLIVVIAALFPLTAAATRFLAFYVDPYLPNVLHLAVALPIVDLTALGAWQLLTPVPGLLFFIFLTGAFARVESRLQRVATEGDEIVAAHRALKASLDDFKQQADAIQDESAPLPPELATKLNELEQASQALDSRMDAWKADRAGVPRWFDRATQLADPAAKIASRIPRALGLAFLTLAFVAAAVLLPFFPVALIWLTSTILGQGLLAQSIRSAGDFKLRHAWPGLAVFILGNVLASGLLYSGPRPVTVHFVSTAGLQDGTYAELGRTDGFVYLRDCDRLADGSIAVPMSAIRLIEARPQKPRPFQPSLLDLVLRGSQSLRLGTSTQCDGVVTR